MQSSHRIRRIIRASVAALSRLASAVVFWTPTVSALGHSLG